MKKKGLIAIYSLMSMIIVGLVITVVVLAASTQYVGSSVSILYVATEISGSVTATYQIGSNDAKSMTDSNGNALINFGSSQPTTLSLLSPNEKLTLGTKEDVLLTYTFNNSGETYYATVSYADTDSSSPSNNLDFYYKTSKASEYSKKSSVIEVPSYGSATYIIKISVNNIYSGASLNGRITWALTKEEPLLSDNVENLTLSIANNGDSSVTSSNIRTILSEDETKFKIVGAVPESAGPTTSSGYVNGNFSERNSILNRKKGLMSVTELTNTSTGAEFYYFCTNQAVVGTTSYVDPDTVYWTSTSDTTLESWYDVPTEPITLYACFMKPTWKNNEPITNASSNVGNLDKNERVAMSPIEPIISKTFYMIKDGRYSYGLPSIISNADTEFSGWKYIAETNLSCFVIPQSMKTIDINYNGERINTSSTTLFLPASLTTIGVKFFYGFENITSIVFADTSSTWKIGSAVSAYSPTDPSTNATNLKSTYSSYTWTKNS